MNWITLHFRPTHCWGRDKRSWDHNHFWILSPEECDAEGDPEPVAFLKGMQWFGWGSVREHYLHAYPKYRGPDDGYFES